LTRKLIERLEGLGICRDVKVVVGGAIPPQDVARLEAMGVDRVFPTGTSLAQIVQWFAALESRGDERGGTP
jgi:methylmalonyl-CoA mutase C-terminal domain/subunit